MIMTMADNPILVDHDHRTFGPQARRVRALGARDLLVDVREQRNYEVVLLDESPVGVQVLRRDANDRRIQSREIIRAITVGTHLF